MIPLKLTEMFCTTSVKLGFNEHQVHLCEEYRVIICFETKDFATVFLRGRWSARVVLMSRRRRDAIRGARYGQNVLPEETEPLRATPAPTEVGEHVSSQEKRYEPLKGLFRIPARILQESKNPLRILSKHRTLSSGMENA